MTSTRRCVEDLIVRARRGELSSAEQAELDEALASSREAGLLFQAGLGFDAASPILPEDEQLVARLADAVARPRSATLRRSSRSVLMVAALILATATAAAAGRWLGLRISHSPPQAPRTTVAAKRSAPATAQRQPAPTPVQLDAAPPDAGSPEPSPHARRMPAVAPPASGHATDKTPAELFTAANRARREGRTADAVRLYEQLVRAHAASPEAQQATLTLGEIHLRAGDASSALECFRRFRGGAMAPEALWGEARALRLLGRVAGERQALQRLTEGFSASAYAEAARKRLAEIGD